LDAQGKKDTKLLESTVDSSGTVTPWFNGNSATTGCNLDGVSITNYRGAADIKIVTSNGQIFFADGAISNSDSNYSIRFVDSLNKVQTLMGSLPLYGDGKQKYIYGVCLCWWRGLRLNV
jgi:hypothetical protein